MLLDSFSAVGFGAFKKRWSVSVGELRGLVAVVGPNGCGKTTFLELALPGAMFRTTPTRGSLTDLAVARDACLEVGLVNGANWTIRHLVDGQSKKSEAVVLKDGVPLAELQSAKVKEFDAWAARHWPSPEVLLSTIFGAQGAGGFLAAKPGERKAILLRVLGVERLERLAEQARERAKGCRTKLDTIAARLADERARGGNVAELEQQIEAMRRDAFRAENGQLAAQKQLDNATEELQRIELIEQSNAAVVRSRQAIDTRIDQARASLADIDERLANCRAVIADGAAIRKAVTDLEALQGEIAEAAAAVTTAEAAAQAALAPWLDVNERILAAQGRANRAATRIRDRAAIEAAQAALPELRAAVEQALTEEATLTTKLDELAATTLAGERDRIKSLRTDMAEAKQQADTQVAHDQIADTLAGGLEGDDKADALVQQHPELVRQTKARLAAARDSRAMAQRRVADAELLAGRATDLDGADQEHAAAEAEALRLAEGYAAAGIEAKAKRKAVVALQSKLTDLRDRAAHVKLLADQASGLAKAEGLVGEREAQKLTTAAELARLVEERKAFEVLAPVPPRPDMPALRAELQRWQDAAPAAQRAVATLEERLEQARASVLRQAELEQQEQAQLVELADWMRHASDLGRDGLQALEIDAAGPELTALTNDLLHGAHGPRFTVRVETQRASADGKKMLEGCEVLVLDTVQGREAEGSTFSGGEKVILSEALALAITVLACRRSGLSDISLVRDESGAALDPANARVYVAMLRKAVEMIGARHCLLVSHVPEVQELCDHRIEVGA